MLPVAYFDIFPTHTPVSYTHLDVYKRQAYSLPSQTYFATACQLSLFVNYSKTHYHHSFASDSSTEIDVYKRQVVLVRC